MNRKSGRTAETENDRSVQPKDIAEATGDLNRAATIALLAYERWQARGCPSGDDQRDWLEAEQEVLAARSARSEDGTSAIAKSSATS